MSWAGLIASTSMSEVNSEVGYSSTASTSFNDTRVRNLGNRTTTSTLIGMDDMRFGLMMPLITYTDGTYANTLYLSDSQSAAEASFSESTVTLHSNGQGQYYTTGSGIVKTWTWCTVGTPSDYTAYMLKISGDTPAGDSVNTSLGLGISRSWSASVTNNTPPSTIDTRFVGTLSIRKTDVIGPYRKVDLNASATAF